MATTDRGLSAMTRRHSWGWSFRLHTGRSEELWIARGRAGGASSCHYHEQKSNLFMVTAGEVEIWTAGQVVPCQKDRPVIMPAYRPHRMFFKTDAELYEFYIADPGELLDPEDIVRLDVPTALPAWAPGAGPRSWQEYADRLLLIQADEGGTGSEGESETPVPQTDGGNGRPNPTTDFPRGGFEEIFGHLRNTHTPEP